MYAERGRPSIDPVIFFKLQLVMFFEGFRSERRGSEAQRALVRPLLLRDPPFQDVVQVAGADDLLFPGVEDGWVKEEWLSL